MATSSQVRARARAALDQRFAGWREVPAKGARPHGGWIRAIRDALGMTAEDLADRMGLTQSAVTRLEKSERSGRIQLDTLQRAAHALECDLVYALVPRRNLDEMVAERARELALERLGRVEHTMALESQSVDDRKMADKLDLLIGYYLTTPGLWRADHAKASEQSDTAKASISGMG
jgi:predicted DNA-binding mobile mystery protein A